MTKATKLPQDWRPNDFDIQYARGRGFSDQEIGDIAEDFATYWTLGAGRNKTHLCWSGSGRSAWATWVRRSNPKPRRAEDKAFVGSKHPPKPGEVYCQRRGWISLDEYYGTEH